MQSFPLAKMFVLWAAWAAQGAAQAAVDSNVAQGPPSEPALVQQAMQALAVPFEANGGQFDERVAFVARTFAGAIYVTRQGRIVYSLPGPVAAAGSDARAHAGKATPPTTRKAGWSLTETLAGAMPLAPVGGDAATAQVTRFSGPHGYQAATYRNVYLGQAWPGVAVELAARGSNVEKLFHVAPHSDAGQIQVRVDGALSLRLGEGGELIVVTGHGDVAYTAPVAFQEIEGRRVDVPVRYALSAAGDGYGFALGAHDPRLPLVIDPLLQSTYLGGAVGDEVRALALDTATGDVVVGGETSSLDFPGTLGGAQPAFGGGTARDGTDAFVARLSGDLKTLRQSTYLGGADGDHVIALAIDAATGDVVVGGRTASTNFPSTRGGAQPAYGGDYDAFVARLSGDLKTLRQSTYLGGTGEDYVTLAIDAATGDVVVGGRTYSTDLPGTQGGAQPAYGDFGDAFVARLSGDLKTLRQSTYLGGTGQDYALALAIDAATGDVVVGGATSWSTDFPGTQGGAQPAYGGGFQDAFVARLSGDLKTLRQSTYLGGTGQDYALALAIDAATGDVVVGGATSWSTDFPGTQGGAQPASGAGGQDAFVARLSDDLKTLRQSTYLGGTGQDNVYALAIDTGTGDVMVGGWTFSTDFPGAPGGAQPALGGWRDGFVARLSGDLKTLRQSTFLGGASQDHTNTLAIDAATGDVVVGGLTYSTDFPGILGGAQPAYGGGFADAFVARLSGDLKALSPQAITFPPQPGQNLVAGGRFAIDPPATASSGLPVSYASATPAVCTVAGSTVTMVGAGTCTLVAS